MQIKLREKYRVVRASRNHRHTVDISGGVGRAARRKARGWRKGWARDYRRLMGITGNNLPRVTCFGTRKDEG